MEFFYTKIPIYPPPPVWPSGVKIIYRGKSGDSEWFQFPLDLTGRQNKVRAYQNCIGGNICLFLENGKLAQCGFPLMLHHFANYFNLPLKMHKNDYVDIFKVKDLKKVFQKFSKPIPACRYCKAQRIPQTWEVSKCQLSEWI